MPPAVLPTPLRGLRPDLAPPTHSPVPAGPAQSGILVDREVVSLFLHFTVNPKPRVDFIDRPRCCLRGKECSINRFQQVESRWGYSGTSDRIRWARGGGGRGAAACQAEAASADAGGPGSGPHPGGPRASAPGRVEASGAPWLARVPWLVAESPGVLHLAPLSFRFSVNKRIFVVGFGLYGSIHGPTDYQVNIQVLRAPAPPQILPQTPPQARPRPRLHP